MISNPFEVAKKCLEKCTCGSGSDLAQVQVTLDKKAQFLADNFVELRQKRVDLQNAQLSLDERERKIHDDKRKLEIEENELNAGIADRESKVLSIIHLEKDVKESKWKIEPWTREVKRLEEESERMSKSIKERHQAMDEERRNLLKLREEMEERRRELAAEVGCLKIEANDRSAKLQETRDALEKCKTGISSMRHWELRVAPLRHEAIDKEQIALSELESTERNLATLKDELEESMISRDALLEQVENTVEVPADLREAEIQLAKEEAAFLELQRNCSAASHESRMKREELRLRAQTAEGAVTLADQTNALILEAEAKAKELGDREEKASKEWVLEKKLQELNIRVQGKRDKQAKLQKSIDLYKEKITNFHKDQKSIQFVN